MRRIITGFSVFALAATSAAQNTASRTKPIHHFIYVGADRENIRTDSLFLNTPSIEGAQIRYLWKALEPAKDQYDFSEIRDDLAFLQSHGKKLWIQLSDVTFAPGRVSVPRYLTEDSTYHGGAAKTYDDRDETNVQQSGWVARRWDAAVRGRFSKLLQALGSEFDGRIEGINLPETAVSVWGAEKVAPQGYTINSYREGIAANMRALKLAFPRSVAMQYANFFPGEWRPTEDKHYLSAVYELAREIGVAVAGPDLMPYNRGQLGNSYPLILESADKIPTGIAVQDGNLAEVNPATKQKVTAKELLDFAMNDLRVDYIFWQTEEPYYSREVIPLLRSNSR